MIDKNNTLELYKIIINEQIEYLKMRQNRVKFFMGITSGLVAGTVTGIFKSTEWFHFALMLLGPIMIIAVCNISKKSVFRLYQLFLETVTMRAKLEQLMGLSTLQSKMIQFLVDIGKMNQ